jgi:hypothetical protein
MVHLVTINQIITRPKKVIRRSFDEIVALVVGLTYKTLRITDEHEKFDVLKERIHLLEKKERDKFR